jgi:D-alanyl-D-alanine endopeptidase (penicillin-binding protein 7)
MRSVSPARPRQRSWRGIALAAAVVGFAVVLPLEAGAGQTGKVRHASQSKAGKVRHVSARRISKPVPAMPRLRSGSAAVVDLESGRVLFEKNADEVSPIASITKLMTAMVVLDSAAPLSEELEITREDVDREKYSRSRLPVGSRLTRDEALLIALMASENRAASALARVYPGGTDAFVAAMNAKAVELGLHSTRFDDPTGLSSANVSTASELVGLITAAHRYPLIREFSTTPSRALQLGKRRVNFGNTNALVKNRLWEISLSKTGYIREAGKCLVMQTWVDGRPVAVVLLDSYGRLTRLADAKRIRDWMRRELIARASGDLAS